MRKKPTKHKAVYQKLSGGKYVVPQKYGKHKQNPYLPGDPRASIDQKIIIILQLNAIITVIFKELQNNLTFFKWINYDKLIKAHELLSTSLPFEKTFFVPQKYELAEFEELPKVYVTKGEWKNFTGTVLQKTSDQLLITFKLFGKDHQAWVKKLETKIIREDVSKAILEKKLELIESLQNLNKKLLANKNNLDFLDKINYQKIRATVVILQDMYGDWLWSVKK
jgi:hypothetical protein